MRPLRLEIEGFTSFVERTELDFSALDLFAITGPTGAGKSSLIDAMIFALYGWVPRVLKEYRQLISHGAERMAVKLDFQVGDERFRVARAVRKSDGKAQVRLDRIVDGVPESLGDRVQEIEDSIERIIGLDHDAFTRSVVLPQGEFDRFLQGKPDERRKILTSLLNLRVYEDMQRIANARATDASKQAGFIEKQLASDYADATPQHLSERRKEHKALQKETAEAEKGQSAIEQGIAIARLVKTARTELGKLDRDLASANQAAAEAGRAEAGATHQQRETQKKLDALAKEATALGFDDARFVQLLQIIPKVTAHIEAVARATELEARQQHATTAAAKTTAALAELDKELPVLEQRQVKATQALKDAKQRLEELKRRHAATALRKGLKRGDPCPVCERPLDHLPAAHVAGLDAAEEAVAAATEEVDTLRQRRTEIGAERKGLETDAKRHDKDLKEAQQTLQKETKAIEGVTRELAKGGIDAAALKKGAKLCAALESERDKLQKAKTATESLQARRQKLETEQTDAVKAIAAAQASAAAAKKRSADLERGKTKAEKEYEREHDRLLALAERQEWRDVQAPPRDRDEVDVLEIRDRDLRARLQTLTRQSAGLERDINNLEQRIQRAADLQQQQQTLKATAVLATELASCLRANQFMAYIQEEALRVLAEDGSTHLEVLSEGRYALGCNDQEFSVVDHWNADETRSVKTLSGGESFLASLALALALAERLAIFSSEGRAQQRLESLFLDEGFGTLDRDTLDIVVQGIEALHGGQRMVGIVTHIRELADRMPARVEVAKQHGRATISIA